MARTFQRLARLMEGKPDVLIELRPLRSDELGPCEACPEWVAPHESTVAVAVDGVFASRLCALAGELLRGLLPGGGN